MAHTSNKVPVTLVLPDGTPRPVRCYQVPVAGAEITIDGTTYQVRNVQHVFPAAKIFIDLQPADSGCSLCEIRTQIEEMQVVIDEILVEVKSDIL